MINFSRPQWLKMLRALIVLQSLVTAWFFVAPDTIPQILSDAQMANDRPLYETLDNIIVPIWHLQAVLCIALWWPLRFTAIGYLACVLAVFALSIFAGPALLSDIDGTLSGIQGLASGAMLMLLYLGGFFHLSRNPADEHDIVS